MNVVIVEDEGITALFLQETIESFNSTVVGVFDEGESLFNFLETNSVDLIFMDIQINGPLDGQQVADLVHKKYPSISFVFLTSFKDTDTIESVKVVRPLGYLIKPVTEQNVEAVLMVVDSVRSAQDIVKIDKISIGKYSYYLDEKTIYMDDKHISLSRNEHLCLEELVIHRDTQVSIEQLLFSIWGGEEENRLSSLRELTYRLRKKLPCLEIVNIPNLGYILRSK